jgi:hypothetical protein
MDRHRWILTRRPSRALNRGRTADQPRITCAIQGHPRARHRGPVPPPRLPRLRRHLRGDVPELCRGDAGEGHPGHYAYISDAHDFHGTAGYVAQLKSYDDAFGAFFDRLAADGINKSNTLLAFTVDQGDHFVGSQPANPGCDGVTVACDWDTQNGHPRVGELNANIDTLVSQQFPSSLVSQAAARRPPAHSRGFGSPAARRDFPMPGLLRHGNACCGHGRFGMVGHGHGWYRR